MSVKYPNNPTTLPLWSQTLKILFTFGGYATESSYSSTHKGPLKLIKNPISHYPHRQYMKRGDVGTQGFNFLHRAEYSGKGQGLSKEWTEHVHFHTFLTRTPCINISLNRHTSKMPLCLERIAHTDMEGRRGDGHPEVWGSGMPLYGHPMNRTTAAHKPAYTQPVPTMTISGCPHSSSGENKGPPCFKWGLRCDTAQNEFIIWRSRRFMVRHIMYPLLSDPQKLP